MKRAAGKGREISCIAEGRREACEQKEKVGGVYEVVLEGRKD